MTARHASAVMWAVIPFAVPALAWAQVPGSEVFPGGGVAEPDVVSQWGEISRAAIRLPLATLLASALALRPRRRGTPTRNLAVIHTQILLAVVGALVMLVVGSSLARAFGIVGAAGLVRYRAKIEDPKDAGVMLSTLAIGLATGVGLWMIALFATVFLLGLLWTVESFEPKAVRRLTVKLKGSDAQAVKPKAEQVLRRHGATFGVLVVSAEELEYDVRWPADRSSDRLSEQLAAVDTSGKLEVEVEIEYE